jgi:hypothetical protein
MDIVDSIVTASAAASAGLGVHPGEWERAGRCASAEKEVAHA